MKTVTYHCDRCGRNVITPNVVEYSSKFAELCGTCLADFSAWLKAPK